MTQDNKQIQFIKGSAILILSNMVIKGINFLLLPLYTKYLTPAELGVSDTITSLTAFILPLITMGLDSAFSAFYFDDRNEEHQKKVLNTIWFTLLISSSIPIIIAGFSKTISESLFGVNDYGLLVGIALVSVSMNLWYIPFALLLRMENRMTLFALINVTASLSMILLNILFVAILHMGAYSLICSTAIIQIVQLVLYIILGKIRLCRRSFDKQLVKKMLRFSLPLVPNAVALWILNLSNRYLILQYCGETEVGIYGVAARFGTAVALVANGVYMSYTTYAYDKKDDSDAPTQYARILNGLTITLLAVCFTGSIFGEEIISIMADDAYKEACVMLSPILFGQLFFGMITIMGYAMGFAKKTKYTLYVTIIGAVLNVILNVIFLPMVGVIAAAYASCISYIIMTILTYFFAQRLYYVDYKILKLMAVVIPLFIVSIFLDNVPILWRIILWVIAATGTLILYRDVVNDYMQLIKKIVKR